MSKRITEKQLKEAVGLLKKNNIVGPYVAYVTPEQRKQLGPRVGEVEIRTGLGEREPREAGK